MSTRKTITTVEAAAEEANRRRQPTDEHDRELAKSIIKTATRDVIETLAEAALVDYIRYRRRSETLAAERRAQDAARREEIKRHADQPPDLYDGLGDMTRQERKRHRARGSAAYLKWIEETKEGRAFEAQEQRYDAEDEESHRQYLQKIAAIIDERERQLKIAWTEELLGSAFALPDGRLTTWGEATIADHQTRRDMFAANAQANVEGAARHAAAITTLQAAGVDTLNDLAKKAAAAA